MNGTWAPPITEGQRIGRRVVVEWLAANPSLPVPDDYRGDVEAERWTRLRVHILASSTATQEEIRRFAEALRGSGE